MRSGFTPPGAVGPVALATAGAAPSVIATWQCVTTGAATHSIADLTVSAATIIDWGDGATSEYTGSGARSHNYAGAGTWTVRVLSALNVTGLALSDNKVLLNSADVKEMSNIASFVMESTKGGAFNSSDVAHWRPTTFKLIGPSPSFGGIFNSSNLVDWRPTTFELSGQWNYVFVGSFSSADVAAWRPTTFRLYDMPVSWGFSATGGLANWTTLTSFTINYQGLSQATVNAVLWELYQASAAPRTVSGGGINLSTLLAPSGTYQAVASPPVSAATPGKEIAYELLNDSLGLFNNWAMVTVTA